jgi:3-deoxy-D-manno-octulosonic-acid transferase
MYLLYNILLLIGAAVLIPYYGLKMLLTGKYHKSLGQKFGLVKPGVYETMKGRPRIWIHAVSVGEVTAAAPIMAKLRSKIPDVCLVLSTSTETGREMAEKVIPDATAMIYFPLDIPFVIRKVMNRVQPDIFVMIETELWPNFLRICKERRVKICLVNGRISPRSFKRYEATRFFWTPVLRMIDQTAVISKTDAHRLIALGQVPASLHVFGNAKYDSFAAKASPDIPSAMSQRLNLGPDEKVLVAGSTHEGEEEIILTVYKKLLGIYPEFKLILVPRHTERAPAVIILAKNEGFEDIVTMSDIKDGKKRTGERIVLVDVIGELFQVYSLATVVFCGGSLVAKGGQNILEPAAWGKVVFFGPHMEDFQDEKALLEGAGAGITIQDGRELFEWIVKLLEDQPALRALEAKGRSAIASNIGAAEKYAELILRNLP